MNCARCGYSEEDNDEPLNVCSECGEYLCNVCYGDVSFEWCKHCRAQENHIHKWEPVIRHTNGWQDVCVNCGAHRNVPDKIIKHCGAQERKEKA